MHIAINLQPLYSQLQTGLSETRLESTKEASDEHQNVLHLHTKERQTFFKIRANMAEFKSLKSVKWITLV